MRVPPERYVAVLKDFVELTKTSLSPQEEVKFFENEAVGRLSMHLSPIRLKAGKVARQEINQGTFSLSLIDWIDAIYDLSTHKSNRVWVTRGGFKFHENRDCKALLEGQSKANLAGKDTYNPQFIERQEAIRYGKKPCLVCKPVNRT
jgi:hypothetical protein